MQIIPIFIGKILLNILFPKIFPSYKNYLKDDKKEYNKLCFTGFYIFLLTNLYLFVLYILVKLNIHTNFLSVTIKNGMASCLLSIVFNVPMFILLYKLIQSINLKNIKKNFEHDEKIIYNRSKLGVSDYFIVLVVSVAISCGILAFFAGPEYFVHYLSQRTARFHPIYGFIMGFFGFEMIFPFIIFRIANTTVITNKKIVNKIFFKFMEPLQVSFEKLKSIQSNNKNFTDMLGFVSEEIPLSIISSFDYKTVDIKNGEYIYELMLVLNNGVELSFTLDKENRNIIYELNKIGIIPSHTTKS